MITAGTNKARLIELARALQRGIRETPEADFCDKQNAEFADMEWKLQTFIETVDGKCAVVVPAAPVAPARACVEERKVA